MKTTSSVSTGDADGRTSPAQRSSISGTSTARRSPAQRRRRFPSIPKSSSDSATLYKFVCEVTASYRERARPPSLRRLTLQFPETTLSVTTTSSKNGYTVGDKVEMKATLYYKGQRRLQQARSLGSCLTPTITLSILASQPSLATTPPQRSTLRASRVRRATRLWFARRLTTAATATPAVRRLPSTRQKPQRSKQSIGSGATLKSSSITAAVTRAAGSGKVSYLIFNTLKSCKLTKSSSSSSSLWRHEVLRFLLFRSEAF